VRSAAPAADGELRFERHADRNRFDAGDFQRGQELKPSSRAEART
jgi:hypothetical protein